MQSDEVIEKTSPNECRSFGPSKKFVTWQGGGRRTAGRAAVEDGQKLKRKENLSFRVMWFLFSYAKEDSNGWDIKGV